MRLDDALARLARERRRLDTDQGRIARRNARRAMIGALRSVRAMLDAEYPAITKPMPVRDLLAAQANSLSWRRFEYSVILAHMRRPWDLDLACRFNADCALAFGVTAKPIVLDGKLTRYMGIHDTNAIRIATGQTPGERWRTLLHEIAHYRVHHHRRAFVRELATVYRMWRDFIAIDRVAAKVKL